MLEGSDLGRVSRGRGDELLGQFVGLVTGDVQQLDRADRRPIEMHQPVEGHLEHLTGGGGGRRAGVLAGVVAEEGVPRLVVRRCQWILRHPLRDVAGVRLVAAAGRSPVPRAAVDRHILHVIDRDVGVVERMPIEKVGRQVRAGQPP